jgi:MFS family permease
MLMLPMTQEFGWSRSQFSYSTSAVMWVGALASPILGRLIDRLGVRPVVLTGTGVLGMLSLVLTH